MRFAEHYFRWIYISISILVHYETHQNSLVEPQKIVCICKIHEYASMAPTITTTNPVNIQIAQIHRGPFDSLSSQPASPPASQMSHVRRGLVLWCFWPPFSSLSSSSRASSSYLRLRLYIFPSTINSIQLRRCATPDPSRPARQPIWPTMPIQASIYSEKENRPAAAADRSGRRHRLRVQSVPDQKRIIRSRDERV